MDDTNVLRNNVRDKLPRDEVVASKFPPLGQRSAAGVLPLLDDRDVPAREAFPVLNAATVVMVQFETQSALDQADAITAVNGVDMVMVGTNDLIADRKIAA